MAPEKLRLAHNIDLPIDMLDAISAGEAVIFIQGSFLNCQLLFYFIFLPGVDLLDGTLALTAADNGQALALDFADESNEVGSSLPWPRPISMDLWRVEHQVN